MIRRSFNALFNECQDRREVVEAKLIVSEFSIGIMIALDDYDVRRTEELYFQAEYHFQGPFIE